MTETNFKKVVDKYSDIVKFIGKLEISEKDQISNIKVKSKIITF